MVLFKGIPVQKAVVVFSMLAGVSLKVVSLFRLCLCEWAMLLGFQILILLMFFDIWMHNGVIAFHTFLVFILELLISIERVIMWLIICWSLMCSLMKRLAGLTFQAFFLLYISGMFSDLKIICVISNFWNFCLYLLVLYLVFEISPLGFLLKKVLTRLICLFSVSLCFWMRFLCNRVFILFYLIFACLIDGVWVVPT